MRKLAALVSLATQLTMQTTFGLAVGLSVGLVSLSALAQQPPAYLTPSMMDEELRFGAEWTLTSDELVDSYPDGGRPVVTTPYARKMISAMEQILRKQYRWFRQSKPTFKNMDFHSKWDRQAFSINYPNGFEMTIFSDPGVLEVNSSPSSVATIKKNIGKIQRDIFNTAKTLGLEPGDFTGSGHMHIEISKVHPETVRNFMADYYNHTGLSAGGLNEDVYNALGPGEMPARNKALLRAAFRYFDNSKFKAVKTLVDALATSYSISLDDEIEDYRESGRGLRPSKYFAMSFKSFENLGTIEIRAIRPQASAASYLKLAKLFSARMKFSDMQRTLGHVVPIGDLPSLRDDPQAALADFDKYVTEAGLNFEDYTEFVLPQWKEDGDELEQYLAARKAKAPKTCTAVFN